MTFNTVKSMSFKRRTPNTNTQTHVNNHLFGGLKGLVLAGIAVYNIILLILGTVVAHNAIYRSYYPISAGIRIKLYFFYCTLPFVVTIYALVEFVLNWCGKLRPLQVLITAPIFVVLYALSFVTYSTTSFCYLEDGGNIDCAYSYVGVKQYYRYYSNTPGLMNNIGYADLVAAVIYFIYFVVAAHVMHKRRAPRDTPTPKVIVDNESAYSFSTMPASTAYNVATPQSFYASQGPSRHADRLSTPPEYGDETAPRKY